jgi:hypothetical protein
MNKDRYQVVSEMFWLAACGYVAAGAAVDVISFFRSRKIGRELDAMTTTPGKVPDGSASEA